MGIQYNRISRIYNLYSASNPLTRYRKITGSITRYIHVGVANAKITLHFMVKYQNKSLNSLKSIYFIYVPRAIHISKNLTEINT